MSTQTTNFGLTKDASTDYYNIDTTNANLDVIDKGLVPYIGTTSGSGNAYAITSDDIKSLAIGLAFSIKFNADSTGACTLNLNSNGAKPVKKANGSNVTNLKASGIYTLRYDGVNFILQGEGASGTATASDLLSGKTASTDAGDITGTMPNIGPETAEIIDLPVEGAEYTIAKGFHSGFRKIRAKISGLVASVIKAGTTVGGVIGTFTSDATAVAGDILSGKTAYKNGSKLTGTMIDRGTANHSLPINGSYTIPSGKHSGSGKVTQDIPTQAAQTITPGTTNKTIPSGRYLTGAQTIKGDANLIPANILSGKSIFGVVGNVIPGMQFVSGVATSSADYGYFSHYSGAGSNSWWTLEVSGLPFKPRMIIAHCTSEEMAPKTLYVQNDTRPGYLTILVRGSTGVHTSGSSGAYVDETGFLLPVSRSNTEFVWYAFA